MFLILKVLLTFVIWNLPPPTPPQELEVTIVAGSAEDRETSARFEALASFDPHMTVAELKQHRDKLKCLRESKGSGEYVFGCNAPKAYHRRVVDIGYFLVETSLAAYEQGGQDAFVAFIMTEIRLSEEAMCLAKMCDQVQALKEE